MHVIINLL